MKNHSLFTFFIFTSFLIIGYLVSIKFFRADYGIASSSMSLISTNAVNPPLEMDNGQRSILLIGSSKISTSHPRLESIWLVTYFKSDSTIRLLPIFPTGGVVLTDFEKQLNQTFDLINEQGNLRLSPTFVNMLEANNFWWSGYLVIDKYAAVSIIDILGGINIYGETYTGDRAIQRIPSTFDNPQEAFSTQANIVQAACRKLSDLPSQLDWSQLFSLIPDHIITDLNANQSLADWHGLLANEYGPSCNYPTLDISLYVR